MSDTTIGLHLDSCLSGAESVQADAYQDGLLEGLQAGREESYETLIARFEHPIYNLVMRLVNDPADANDVVQEVFLKVFRNVRTFRGQSSLKTWIYRIAVNEAYNHRRWFSRHRKQEVGLEPEDEGSPALRDSISDPGRTPFDWALNEERHILIEAALQDVNPSFRAAVVLRDMDDLSYEEIADIMQVSMGTVKSRIMRGRESLRKSLESRLSPGPANEWVQQPAGQAR